MRKCTHRACHRARLGVSPQQMAATFHVIPNTPPHLGLQHDLELASLPLSFVLFAILLTATMPRILIITIAGGLVLNENALRGQKGPNSSSLTQAGPWCCPAWIALPWFVNSPNLLPNYFPPSFLFNLPLPSPARSPSTLTSLSCHPEQTEAILGQPTNI